MGIPPKKKRRQHYVWRHYLEAWTTEGTLWCRRERKIFEASPQNVAHERDFYRLREMSERDLEVVRALLIRPLEPPMLRNLAEGWIPHFTELFRLKRAYEAMGRKNAEAESVLDSTIHNLEEDLLAGLETHGKPLLDALRLMETNILSDDEQSVFHTWFIAAQYFRTPRMLSRMLAALNDAPGFNAEASFGLMRTIMANNVGYALYARRRGLRLTYLQPSGHETLITGDQPIVNTKALGTALTEAPDELELYYPLSPHLGVLFDFDGAARTTTRQPLSTAAFHELER